MERTIISLRLQTNGTTHNSAGAQLDLGSDKEQPG